MNFSELGRIKISKTKISELPATIKRDLALLATGAGILISFPIWALINFSFADLLCSFPVVLMMLGVLWYEALNAFDRLRSTIRESERDPLFTGDSRRNLNRSSINSLNSFCTKLILLPLRERSHPLKSPRKCGSWLPQKPASSS
jgi:hypothetical protein